MQATNRRPLTQVTHDWKVKASLFYHCSIAVLVPALLLLPILRDPEAAPQEGGHRVEEVRLDPGQLVSLVRVKLCGVEEKMFY